MRLEVVGAVHDQVNISEKLRAICGSEVCDFGFNGDARIEGHDLTCGSDGLGKGFGGVGFVEENLALKVAGLDVIAVDNAEVSHSGTGQKANQGGAGSAAAYHRNSGRGEVFLSMGTDSRKEYLPRI